MTEFSYGLLLPHFGRFATRENLFGFAAEIERLGFDSVWVRDHVVYQPHSHEESDPTHLEPLIVLSGMAAQTHTIKLGTATLIPHRHPIYTAGTLASLDHVAGPGRLIAGFGLGNYDHEFAALGMANLDRKALLREQVQVMRGLWNAGDQGLSFAGEFYEFKNVSIAPRPTTEIRIMYGGSSRAAVRRSVEYCDGWMASRMPRFAFKERMALLRTLSEKYDRKPVPVVVTSYISPGRSMADGSRWLDLVSLASAMEHSYGDQASGPLESLSDFDGAAIAGTADDIIEGIRAYQTLGASHFIFDLRRRFQEWQDQVRFVANEVLARLHREDGRGRLQSAR